MQLFFGYAGGSPGGAKAGVHLLLLLTQVAIGGYYLLAKVALSAGVHMLVFAVYRDAFGLSILIPFAYFSEIKTRKSLTIPVLKKFTLLGFIGVYLNQFLFYNGLVLTNATFASAMQNLVPVFTLLIAAFYKLEHLGVKQRCGQAKILGLIICVSGATLMTCYKGPPLLRYRLPIIPPPQILPDGVQLLLDKSSSTLGIVIDPWKLGALSLVGNTFCLASFINIQACTLAKHPAPISLAASVFSIGGFMLTATAWFLVKNPSDWIITGTENLVAIGYSGAVVSCLAVGAIAWSISKTGPVLAASYGPFQAVATAILAFMFFRETFYLGSFIGSVLIIVGLGLITWGQKVSKVHIEGLSTLNGQVVATTPPHDLKEPLLA